MSPQDWNESFARAVAIALSGATGDHTRPDDPFLIRINSRWEPLDFRVPTPLRDLSWLVEIDTADPAASGRAVDPSTAVTLSGRSLVLLRGRQP
jgi:isoamylase